MGLYIEVEDKAAWLMINGTNIVPNSFTAESIKDEDFLVCLIDNGPFLAAGVAYNEQELGYILKEVTDEKDARPKFFFEVPKKLLKDVCPSWNDYVSE